MKRVLVVDDHEENVYLLQVLLEGHGFEVATAHNGVEALAKAEDDSPDAVISDILMPVMDGFTLCRAWRARDDLRNIPFIFYTATYTDPRDEKLALDLGADAFIIKPVEPEEFIAKVVTLLEKTGGPRPDLPRTEPVEGEQGILRQYSEALVRKLEDRTAQLEQEIAERKHAEESLKDREEQLRQAQKMEAMGQLAGGIAHDFNNLLTAILGYSDLILSTTGGVGAAVDPTYADILEDVRQIKLAAMNASELTRQILAFARQQTLRPETVVLNEVATEARPLLERTLGETIDLEYDLAPDLGSCEVDRHQLVSVLLNLALNSRDAMSATGKLTVESANVELDEDYCQQHHECTPGAYVMLAVSDTGEGMDRETQAHIFEPFFTTKQHGQGTGLGLSVVHGIIKQSGGSIEVQSQPGIGSRFSIYLPRTPTLSGLHCPTLAAGF